MRPCAQVGKIALFIEGYLFACGQVFDERDLIFFGKFGHQLDRIVPRQSEPLDGQIALDDLFHFRFYFGKVVLRDGRLKIDVVIKAVLDGRPDGELAGRIDRFYRLREDVRRRVAVYVEPLFIFQGDDLDLRVVFHDVCEVCQMPVHLGGDGCAGKTFADVRRDLFAAYGRRIFFFVSPFQCDDHKSLLAADARLC